MELSGQLKVSAALHRGKNCRYPLDSRLCGTQSHYGSCGEDNNSFPYPESNPGHPACSLSLYRLSYPGSILNIGREKFSRNKQCLPTFSSIYRLGPLSLLKSYWEGVMHTERPESRMQAQTNPQRNVNPN
jgi:hypothetical protein